MLLEGIELFHVRMPLLAPWRTAYGSDDAIESVLARMTSGGRHGWGEAAPLREPAYSPEYAAGVFEVCRRFLAPRLIGRAIDSGEALQQALGVYKGNRFAKGALDMAWWDLRARLAGRPLWRLLGGRTPSVPVGKSFGVQDSIPDLLNRVAAALDNGFPRIKLKFTRAWGVEVVEAVRERFPDAVLHIDCNSSFTLDDLPMFRELDRFKLAMIEQPLGHDDLLDHAELQAHIDTPLCLDESLTSADKARQALAVKACGWFNLKCARVGGLTEALAIHRLAQQAGMPCWVGAMLESAVGARHSLALATLPGMAYPNSVLVSRSLYPQDLAEPEVALAEQGRVEAGEEPGIAADPVPGRLEAMTIEHAELEVD